MSHIPIRRRRPSTSPAKSRSHRAARKQRRVHVLRPSYPAVIVSADGKVKAATSQADALAEAERMLVDQLAAEGKHLTVLARVAAAMVAGAAVR